MEVGSILDTASTFFGSMCSPLRVTRWPRYSASVANSTHLDAFIDRPAHLRRSNTMASLSIICLKELSSRSSKVVPVPVDQIPTSSK